MKTKKLKNEKTASYDSIMSKFKESHIIFDGEMRKTFIKGVLQDAKGWFESKTDGAVEVMYEDFNLEGHEFGFKMTMSKTSRCTKQMFNEASCAFINIISYMLCGDDEHYDVSFSSSSSNVEVEVVSNW